MRTLYLAQDEGSLIYTRNSRGRGTVLWGKPDVTGAAEDAVPSRTIYWVLPSKKLFTHAKTLPRHRYNGVREIIVSRALCRILY